MEVVNGKDSFSSVLEPLNLIYTVTDWATSFVAGFVEDPMGLAIRALKYEASEGRGSTFTKLVNGVFLLCREGKSWVGQGFFKKV